MVRQDARSLLKYLSDPAIRATYTTRDIRVLLTEDELDDVASMSKAPIYVCGRSRPDGV